MSQVGDIGTTIKATIVDQDGAALDVSGASTLQLLFLKPTGVLVTQTATLTGDGTDGIIQYVTVSGDLDVPGVWKSQGYIVDAGKQHKSSVDSFHVKPNI